MWLKNFQLSGTGSTYTSKTGGSHRDMHSKRPLLEQRHNKMCQTISSCQSLKNKRVKLESPCQVQIHMSFWEKPISKHLVRLSCVKIVRSSQSFPMLRSSRTPNFAARTHRLLAIDSGTYNVGPPKTLRVCWFTKPMNTSSI